MTAFVRLGAVLGAVALSAAAGADDKDLKKAVKGLVEKMQAATLKDDFETVIDMTHPKAVEQLGGREKALATTKTVMKQLKDGGLAIKALSAGEPGEPARGEKELYVVVPTKIEMTAAKGKVNGTGFILGVSADDGKTWKFVDGAPGPDTVRKMFPGIPKALELPKPDYKVIKD
jgi:hypothetical protein